MTHKTDSDNCGAAVALVWCLKQITDLILEFLISGSFFFRKKQLLDYYAIILVVFPLVGCVDEVVDTQVNDQRYRYDIGFIWCHTFAFIHSMNGKKVC